MENKFYQEEIKYDIKNLDNKINSLNLFNNIMQYKHNEIRELINNMKKNIKEKIENDTYKLPKWSDKKESLIFKAYIIMFNKSDSDLGTKDLNEIKNILVEEVINTPNFFDAVKNESQEEEIMKELGNYAETIGKNYLKRIKEDISPSPSPSPSSPPPPPPPQVNYFKATPYTGVSIVDGLAAIGEIRTYDYRAQIAEKNGISGYKGTPEQNTHMLNLLKQGKLIKP